MSKRSQHIWTLENWKADPEFQAPGRRSGLRLYFDKDVDPDIRFVFKVFGSWLRYYYDFPIRVPLYIKSDRRIKDQHGESVCGTMWQPGDHAEEPFGRIATGDYRELCEKMSEYNAMCNILVTVTHELTHYFQWLNDLPLTDIGRERQATKYSEYVLYEYLDDCDSTYEAAKPAAGDSTPGNESAIDLPIPAQLVKKRPSR